jgi:hypothetical protein
LGGPGEPRSATVVLCHSEIGSHTTTEALVRSAISYGTLPGLYEQLTDAEKRFSAISGPTVALMTLGMLLAGMANGLAGFGFALVGTMAHATVTDPTTAVVCMIIPILAVNLSLVRDLSREELRTCSRRFGPLVGAALVGTVAGPQWYSDRLPACRSRTIDARERDSVPESLAVIGGGYVGCEDARMYGRFGADITVFQR